MTQPSYIIAALVMLCYCTSAVQSSSGVVSVVISDPSPADNITSQSETEFMTFDFETLEWQNDNEDHNNELNWADEWTFEEAGVDVFDLTNQQGDEIMIKPHNDSLSPNEDLSTVLGKVTTGGAASGGYTGTVASHIGNSIASALELIQKNTQTNTSK